MNLIHVHSTYTFVVCIGDTYSFNLIFQYYEKNIIYATICSSFAISILG